MEQNKRKALVATAVACLLATAGATTLAHSMDAAEGKVHCYGINKCKGTGDCGGKGRSCAGTNECSGKGFIDLDKDDCLRIKDGRLTEEG